MIVPPARIVTIVVPAATIAFLGWTSGGYFPRTWGVLLLGGALVLLGGALLRDTVEAGRPAILFTGALAGLAAWQLLSGMWGSGLEAPVLEAERTLVYLSCAGAAVVSVSRGRAAELVFGVAAGASAVTVGGLAEHLFPTTTRASRLELPVGYANAAGVIAGLALVLALSLACDGSRARRALAGAVAVPAATTLYLTLSRGSVVATGVGVVVLLALRRSAATTAAIILLPVGAAVLLAARTDGLTGDVPLETARDAGRTMALQVVLLSLAAGAIALLARSGGRTSRIGLAGALAAAVVLVAGVAGLRAVDQFRSAPPAQAAGVDRRLLSTSTSVRAEYWRVAAGMIGREPLLGEGAGSFERRWLQERPVLHDVRDAHNLYLEALAELGPIGLLLLLVALGTPVYALVRARRSPLVATAGAGYSMLLVHAAVDWDWELPIVVLCALWLGAALLLETGGRREALPRRTGKAALVGVGTAVAACALVVHVGNSATATAEDALAAGRPAAAESAARRARRWAPWSARALEVLGEAQLLARQSRQAKRSFRHAVRLDPESWSAWRDLALVSTGEVRRQALERAVQLNPLSPDLRELTNR